MSDYDQRQADRTKQENERTVKVGELRGRATGDIKKTDEIVGIKSLAFMGASFRLIDPFL